ncbi:MAG: BatA domain-containing protein [Saprospiraceae bacterium]|nr:BatA domain-containing protein [Saprospiraceae bacterium]
MNFVYPSFLWALLALSIPIIIHLFHFRRFRTVYFTNVRFLKEVKEQTATRSRIKHFLVLLARMAAIAALVLAFAQPYIPNKDNKLEAGSKDVSIFFDNSFSMALDSEDAALIEKARSRAEEIVSAYGPDDQIQIITCDLEGRDQRLLSQEDALSRIREVVPTYKVSPLSKVLARQKQTLELGENKQKELFIISDFQENISDIASFEDTSITLNIIPLQAVAAKNIAIDTAWFESPVQALNQTNDLIVRIRNYSDREVTTELSLILNNNNRPGGSLVIPPRASVTDTLDIGLNKTGWHEALLRVKDHPIDFDNEYHFTFYVDEQVDILEIYEDVPNPYTRATFQENTYFNWKGNAVGQVNYSELQKYDLIVLSNLNTVPSGLTSELNTYIRGGGNVLAFPTIGCDLIAYNALNKSLRANTFTTWALKDRKVSFINYQEFVFNDVFEDRRSNIKLPETKGNFKLQKRASAGEEVLLRYRDGGSFIGKYTVDRGNYYLCAAPLSTEYSNLVENAEIFVPMLYRMALATGQERKIAYQIGQDNVLETPNRPTASEIGYKIAGTNQEGEFRPSQQALGSKVVLGVNNQIRLAGFYDLFLTQGEILDKFAYNYDRNESLLKFLSIDAVKELFSDRANILDGDYAQDFGTLIRTQSRGVELWKWCLIFALIFLAVETLLIRLWKT